jgi:hypothetical protein
MSPTAPAQQCRPGSAVGGRRLSLPARLRIETESCPGSPIKRVDEVDDPEDKVDAPLVSAEETRFKILAARVSVEELSDRLFGVQDESVHKPKVQHRRRHSVGGEPRKSKGTCAGTEESADRLFEKQDESRQGGQPRPQTAEKVQRHRRHSVDGKPRKNKGADAGIQELADRLFGMLDETSHEEQPDPKTFEKLEKLLSRRRNSVGDKPQKKSGSCTGTEELSDRLREMQDEACQEGQLRREAAETVQRRRRHSVGGEPWKSGGACAGTVRSASLSRTRGSTTSGLFSDCKPLEACVTEYELANQSRASLNSSANQSRMSMASRSSWERSQEISDEGRLRRQAAEANQRSQRHSLTGAAWKNSGACAGTVRTAALSRSNGSTTSGLFSDCKPLEASEYTAALASKEMSCDAQDEGRLRRQEAEENQRKQRHSLTGAAWKNSGACAGTVRSAGLSRTHGSTTSGLFSECKPLEACDYSFGKKSKELSCQESRDTQDEGRLRREAAESTQRSQRHSLTGEPWKNSGACAGTVRTACLSRTHGSTTSGLFCQPLLLEGSDCASIRSRPSTAQKQRQSICEVVAGPWKSGGACAGTVRAPGLSRTHGSTVSGLFSDVQPLAGSESLAAMREKAFNRRAKCSGPVVDIPSKLVRSLSQPSLCRSSIYESTTASLSEETISPTGSSSTEETAADSRRESPTGSSSTEETAVDSRRESPTGSSSTEETAVDSRRESPTGSDLTEEVVIDSIPATPASVEGSEVDFSEVPAMDKPCVGSAFATVRAARTGGA